MDILCYFPIDLGVCSHLKGYPYLLDTMEFALKSPKTIDHFPKLIFPDVARKHHTTVCCIERDLRTIVRYCWNSPNRRILQEISFYPLERKPTLTQFLEILYWHMRFELYFR